MSDWWHVAQLSAPALGSAVICLGLRRYVRAVLWNVLLKHLGVEAAERRDIAARAARRDLRIDGSGRPQRRSRPKDRTAPQQHSRPAARTRHF